MTLDENDFLTFQLYTASKTPRVKKGRQNSRILLTLMFVIFAYLFYRSNNEFLAIYFLVASAACLIFYPLYSRWRYKQHFRKYVHDTYKARFGEKTELEITDDAFITKGKGSEIRINKSDIQEINEIKDYYYLNSGSGLTLIISKLKTEPEEMENIKKELSDLANNRGVKHNIELDWKWK